MPFSKSFFLTGLLIITSSAFAETAVKWTDSSGTVFYGTRPPAGARNVSKLQPKNYSRYSPSKSLNPYGKKSVASNARAALTQPTRSQETQSQETQPQAIEIIKPKKEEPAIPDQLVKLEGSKAEIKLSDKQEIVSCRTTVTNRNMVDIEGVQVSFEFLDGTIVSADGPTRLNAKQSALFSIPEENLPLSLSPGTKAEAQVVINSDSDL